MRIAIDIDGVLADFTAAYIKVINSIWTDKIPEGYQPKDWWWTDVLNNAETNRIWRRISEIEGFWEDLKPHMENVEALLAFQSTHHDVDIYFVTSRVKAGHRRTTLVQTSSWLRDQYVLNSVTPSSVIIVPEGGRVTKGHIYDALNIEYSIDDLDRNVIDACLYGPKGHKSYLLDRSWNQSATDLDGWRVPDLETYLIKVVLGD